MAELSNVSPTRSGFGPLFRRESTVWWRGSRWLIQLLLGIGAIGLLAVVLFILPQVAAETGETIDGLDAGRQIFFGMGFFAVAIAIVILTQDTIIAEKQSGTAEWVLSKPISRSAYVLAKLAAHGLGIFALLIVVPNALAYALFSVKLGAPYPVVDFVIAAGLMTLHALFYLSLSLMLGAWLESRGILLGVTLGSLLGGELLANFIGDLALYTPWPLSKIAVAVAAGATLPAEMLWPVIVTAVLTVVAVGAALFTFRRVEL